LEEAAKVRQGGRPFCGKVTTRSRDGWGVIGGGHLRRAGIAGGGVGGAIPHLQLICKLGTDIGVCVK